MKSETKGMIIAVEGRVATVLTNDGQFVKTTLPAAACRIGDQVALEGGADPGLMAKFWAAVRRQALKPALQGAALMLVAGIGLGSWTFPAGRVYIEVNPSIGLTYNLYHRVIGYEGFNEDGERVIEKTRIYGKRLEDGVAESLRVMDEQGYIRSGEEAVSGVLIGYSDEQAASEAVAGVSKMTEETKKPVALATVQVTKTAEAAAKVAKAEKKAISPIKAALADKSLDQEAKESSKSENGEKEAFKRQKAVIEAAKALDKKTTAELIRENRDHLKLFKEAVKDKLDKKTQGEGVSLAEKTEAAPIKKAKPKTEGQRPAADKISGPAEKEAEETAEKEAEEPAEEPAEEEALEVAESDAAESDTAEVTDTDDEAVEEENDDGESEEGAQDAQKIDEEQFRSTLKASQLKKLKPEVQIKRIQQEILRLEDLKAKLASGALKTPAPQRAIKRIEEALHELRELLESAQSE